jgi:hypothetical protein
MLATVNRRPTGKRYQFNRRPACANSNRTKEDNVRYLTSMKLTLDFVKAQTSSDVLDRD